MLGILISINGCVGPVHDESYDIVRSKCRLRKLHYENSSGEKGVTTFYYDENNTNFRTKWELLDGSRSSINYMKYDNKNNLIEKYRIFSDSLTSRVHYIYDDENKLLEEHFWRSDFVSGFASYEYEKDQLVLSHCKGWNGWIYGDILYEYNDSLKTKGFLINEKDTIASIDFKYNSNKDLEKEYWNYNDRWNQTFIYEYETVPNPPESYTSSNVYINESKSFVVEKEEYLFNDSIGGPSFFKYDTSNKLVEKVFERGENFRTVTKYKYDDHGVLFSSHRVYSNGRKAAFFYSYDENRNLTERLFYRSDGVKGYEKYDYESGKLMHADLKNLDSWISGTIQYNHDENGEVIGGEFESTKGLRAQLRFEYDQNNNLKRIFWNFANGMTQEYIFTYRNTDSATW